jgi:hypothetical protein
MAKVIAVTDAFRTLAELQSRLGLSQAEQAGFFAEWRTDLPGLSTEERDGLKTDPEGHRLTVLRQRLLYHRADGDLLEGTVMLLVASPLLELAGFYDAPFKLKAEAAVEIAVDDGEEVLRGRIDALILQQDFWVLVLEAKKTTIST